MSEPLVIVGNGMAAARLVDELSKSALGRYAVAVIGEVLEVPLARPRKRLELATNAAYLKCRQRVLEFLYERQRFVEAA